jgi:hypothetical protein
MKELFEILLVLWELPQNILFIIIYIINEDRMEKKITIKDFPIRGRNVYIHYTTANISGIALGNNIIMNKKFKKDVFIKKHECGHTIQSLRLGALYLLVIGIPSFIMSQKGVCKTKEQYYDFYTEKWANKLGGNL